ncbi:MAG: hypothetical protein AAF703_05510 [Cyanobacteria bacterium P01_D01_bin.105]
MALLLDQSQSPSQARDQSQGHILLVGQTPHRVREDIESYSRRFQCPVAVADSPAQAIAQAQLDQPYLVILAGESVRQWSSQMANQLRQSVQSKGVVIVAITDSSELSWKIEPEDTGLDGFFVRPLSPTVLNALNDSAIAKHRYWQCA